MKKYVFALLLPLAAFAVYGGYREMHGIERITAIAVAKNDPAICDDANAEESDGFLSLSIRLRAQCYNEVAVANDNPAACAYLNDDADFCYDKIAKHTGNWAVCDEIKRPMVKGECHGRVAAVSKDDANCASITDTTAAEKCYLGFIGTGHFDVDFCDQHFAGFDNDRTFCIRIAAMQANDPSICDRITTDIERENCKCIVKDRTARC